MRRYLVLTFIVIVAILGAACGDSESSTAANPTPAASSESTAITATASGLQYKDLKVGAGEEARLGATAVVHYTGWLVDGTKFDSSVDRGVPFEFVLGRGSGDQRLGRGGGVYEGRRKTGVDHTSRSGLWGPRRGKCDSTRRHPEI